MTEQEAKMWIEEVTNDLVEIGYTIKETPLLCVDKVFRGELCVLKVQ